MFAHKSMLKDIHRSIVHVGKNVSEVLQFINSSVVK